MLLLRIKDLDWVKRHHPLYLIDVVILNSIPVSIRIYVQLDACEGCNKKTMWVNTRNAQRQCCPFKRGLYISQVCEAGVSSSIPGMLPFCSPSCKKQWGRSNQLSVPKNRAHQIPRLQNGCRIPPPRASRQLRVGHGEEWPRATPSEKLRFHVPYLALSFQAATSIGAIENNISSLLPGGSTLSSSLWARLQPNDPSGTPAG